MKAFKLCIVDTGKIVEDSDSAKALFIEKNFLEKEDELNGINRRYAVLDENGKEIFDK